MNKIINGTQSSVSKCERGERRIDVIELIHFLEVMKINPIKFMKDLIEKMKPSQEVYA